MYRSIALLAACLSVSAQALADDFEQAAELLERMATAMRDMTYQGTFVYVRGEDVDTMRITHVKDADGVRERMYSKSGPHREIVRDEQGVRCVLGESGPAFSEPLVSGSVFPEFPADALRQARSQYLFQVGTKPGRIAGYNARRIRILARDEFRYGYDFWVELHSGLLLRWVLYDSNRKMLAKLMFTELKVGDDVDHGELVPTAPKSEMVVMDTETPKVAPIPRKDMPSPSDLPPGFRLAGHAVETTGDGSSLDHLIISDGLATVSVYLEASGASNANAQGLSAMGTTNAWSRTGASRQVTAIGEVPPITVRNIGTSFLELAGGD